MATYEVETIYYTNTGSIKTKEWDLFNNKKQAVNHMRAKLNSSSNSLTKQGKVSDGEVKLIDDRGITKQVIMFGEL
tara:strand:+ start:5674 stop:5901 length:228 start_codon:yes stop_codon:yes gene_type:complete